MPRPAMAGGCARYSGLASLSRDARGMETGGTLTARLRPFFPLSQRVRLAGTPRAGARARPGQASGHHADRALSHRSPNSASYPRCRRHAQSTVHIGYLSADSAAFWLLHGLGGGGRGDTEGMNRERAETYLRVLAEAELRRATSQPWGDAPQAGYAARVKRVAQVLAFVGALDEGPLIRSWTTSSLPSVPGRRARPPRFRAGSRSGPRSARGGPGG
jgi:hypothetical protein